MNLDRLSPFRCSIFCLLLLSFSYRNASAQCVPTGTNFSTQAQIDAAGQFFDDCPAFFGNISVSGADITNLDSMVYLTSINGNLSISGCPLLNDLDGLANITSISGSLTILNASGLTSLSGLNDLTTVGALGLQDNSALTSLDGLDNLATITAAGLTLRNNGALGNVNGLAELDNITGVITIDNNDALTSLAGLVDLASITGNFELKNNNALPNLDGLSALTTIDGEFELTNNAALASITGLSTLSSNLDFLTISNNPSLTSLAGLESIVLQVDDHITITNNTSLSVCNILNFCEFIGENCPPFFNIGFNAPGSSCDNLALFTACGFACGNGVVEGCEPCDDGNNDYSDGCTGNCIVEAGWNCTGEPSVCTPICGDGLINVAGGEGCDDGDTMDGDGCSAICEVEPGWECTGEPSVCTATCGDGIINGTEGCDDGDTMDGDGCSAVCEVEPGYDCTGEPSTCTTTCGDGIVVGAEGCDDGDTMDGDGCSAVCEVEPGYGCTGEPSTCTTTCGDGIIAGTEECDDGDTMDGDGCSAVCEVEPGYGCTGEPSTCTTTCGDGIVAGTEECDDGDTMDGDGCSAVCEVEPGYGCTGEPSTCTTTCGDGIIAGTEECDDGDTMDGDGCSAVCEVEPGYGCTGEPSTCTTTCGDGIVAGTEECDDGDTMDGDGCSAVCEVEPGYGCTGEPSTCTTTCGDGIIAGTEECDDGDTMDGDGCSAVCEVEDGWACTGEPSVCVEGCPGGVIPGNLVFNTQSDLDDFAMNYPGCTQVAGNVTIDGTMTDLSALSSITTIGGDLWIIDCDNLPSLAGLSSLTTINGGFYYQANALATLSQLFNLTYVGGPLTIWGNDGLTTLDGLQGVEHAEHLHIWETPLTNLNGLDGLVGMCQYVSIIDNPALQSLDGLSSLSGIFDLEIFDNPMLSSISALSSLNIVDDITISFNPELTALTGLDNISLSFLSSLTITNNSSLSTCDVASICNYLSGGGTPLIQDNAPGCDNVSQVETACGACGNGLITGTEGCDDGNTMDGDGCSASCQVEHAYTCTGEPSICASTCGDGLVASDEGCDDGNTFGLDGCDASCEEEPGYECTSEPSACNGICGDGLIRGTEGCDDGNSMDGDGCSSTCTVEPGYACFGEPSVCTEAADYTFTGSGNWNNPANWDANGVPPPVLPSGSSITINGTGPCATDIPSLEIGAGVSLTIALGKTLSLEANTAMFVGGTLTINGSLELPAGPGSNPVFAAPGCSIQNNGSFDFGTDRGIILMGSMNNTGSLANNGYLYIQPGGQLDNCGTFTNNGTMSSEGSFINCASATIVNAASGQISCTAEITGGALVNHGGVIVGCSPGLMSVMGDFTTDGELNMELEGTTAIQQYDQLSVTGVATLSGTMSVTFLNGFTPAVGNSFTLITYGSRVGTFSTINIPCPACWNIDYQAGQLVLTHQSALPAELVKFTATPVEQQVQLDWQTATETNNHGFDLQRSQDAKHWESITWVNGQGNSQAIQNYQHMDKKPKPGINYYRLRQVDFDGASRYSKVLQVEVEGKEHKLEVLPNPNSGQFRLELALPKGMNYQVSISNTNGQIKWIQGGTSSGEFTLSPSLDSPLPSGIYFVKASTAYGQVVYRFVVN